MVEPRDQGDNIKESAPPKEQSDNLKEASREGTEEAAKKAVQTATDRREGKPYYSGLTPTFGARPEIFDSSLDKQADQGSKELPGVGATLAKVVDLASDPSKMLDNLPPADLLVNEAGPKVGQKSGDTPGDAGAKPGDAGAQPGDAGAKPGDAGAQPGDAGAKPGDAGAQPGDAGAKPGFDASKGGVADRDADGRPTVIDYADGQKLKVTYDGEGNPTKVTANDNSRWEKVGDQWKQFDKDGKPVKTPDFTVDVARDGTLSFTETKSGYKEVYTTNGDLTKTFPDKPDYKEIVHGDGSYETRFPDNSAIFKDQNDRITSVVHKDGSKTVPEYKDGKAVKFTEIDAYGRETGSTVWDEQAKRWSIRDRHGEKGEVGYLYGDVKMNADGEVVRKGTFSDTNEVETRTYHRDGGVTRQLRDGSSVHTDVVKNEKQEERIRELQSQYRKELADKVPADQLDRKSLEKALKTIEDEKVRELKPIYEKQLKEQSRERAARSADGSSPIISDEAAAKEAERLARAEVEKPYGTGEVTHVKYPNGKTADFQYDKDGQLSEFKDASGTTHRKVDGHWNRVKVEKDGTESLSPENANYKTKPNGDLENRTGNTVETTRQNGTFDRIEFWEGQARVKRQESFDDHGRRTSATYPGKETGGYDSVAVFSYDRDGKLDGISDADPSVRGQFGDHWVRSRDGSWTKFDSQGNKVDEAKSIKVEPDGKIVITHKDMVEVDGKMVPRTTERKPIKL